MTTITILNNDFVTLNVHPDAKIIYHTFHKPIGGEPLRKALMAGCEAMQKYGATKWLSDDRLNASLSDEDRGWGNDVWVPAVIAAGWKHWALVVPEAIRGRMDMNVIVNDYYERGIVIMVFTNPEEAFQWLAAQ